MPAIPRLMPKLAVSPIRSIFWQQPRQLVLITKRFRVSAESVAHLRGPRLEEPIKAEPPGFPDLSFELIPCAVAQPMNRAEDETVLLLCTPVHTPIQFIT